MKKVLVLNGPNINRLGKREEEAYGNFTLRDLEENLIDLAQTFGYEVDFFQSQMEGELIEQLHQADGYYSGVIFNPAAYTHTSVALRDAILSMQTPVIEVHISNVYQRESFRHVSLTAPACSGQIVGFGLQSYRLAFLSLVDKEKSLNEFVKEREL